VNPLSDALPKFDLFDALNILKEDLPGVQSEILVYYTDHGVHIRIQWHRDVLLSKAFEVSYRELTDNRVSLLNLRFQRAVREAVEFNRDYVWAEDE
jgi:hypothetical protein